MARKLVACPHCKGKMNCTRSGGRSCKKCLSASGRGIHEWSVVRCSYCGGKGKIWEETEDAPAEVAEAPAAPSEPPAEA
jgi:DnaJ-class molecular chaperone